jgi:HEAT repeat protein
MQVCDELDPVLRRAFERLSALHEGYAGVTEVIAYGRGAIPALVSLLNQTDSSGLYERRRRAVSALAALGAYDVLVQFLSTDKKIADPVVRVGEDAVINAAARALVGVRDERILPMLLVIANRRPMSGVIEALGSTREPVVIPYLIEALREDDCRVVAEQGLRRMGRRAYTALIRAATGATGRPDNPSNLRLRRSAAKLL